MRHCFIMLAAATAPLFGQGTITFSGIVTDPAGAPVAAASVQLENAGTTTTTGADGHFSLTGSTAIRKANPEAFISIREGTLFLSSAEKTTILAAAYSPLGQELASMGRQLEAGSHVLKLPDPGSGIHYYKVKSGRHETVFASPPSALEKQTVGAAAFDVLKVTKSGFLKYYLSVGNAGLSNITIKMLAESSPKFSFFVISQKAMQDLSGNLKGFGGDFRYGETGPGAGLRGADKLCAAVAERSMPGSGSKGWRAFLSVTADANGKQVDAINRIGEGPWYDRIGRLVSPKKADLLNIRPLNGDPAINNNLPNEDGIPNHRPDPTKPEVDNHRTVTGSNAQGKLKSATSTCKDWTIADGAVANGKPGCGLSWSRDNGSAASDNWISSLDNPGCAAGFEFGLPSGATIIGGGGGYGGYYCFALNP